MPTYHLGMEVGGALFLAGLVVFLGYQFSLILRVALADRAGDTDRANELRLWLVKLRLAWVGVFVLLTAALVVAAVT